ncbi:gpx1 [Symbiodinium necroappetens]|uniref:Glutathione peroxidase n=1 Tax=Symbiodinium necroappetens TaxID=1628268 RepID=A0A812ZFG2_9DINO|nr:gpx1 [Symbiodinium necroappetens]
MHPAYHHAATVQYAHPQQAQPAFHPTTAQAAGGFTAGQPAVQSFAQGAPGQPQFTFYTNTPGAMPSQPLGGFQVAGFPGTQPQVAMGMVPTTQAAMQLPPSVSYSPAYPLAAGAMPPPPHSIVQTQSQGQPAESAQSESSYESSSEESGLEATEGQGDQGQHEAKAESEGIAAAKAEDAEEPDVATVPSSVPSSVSLPPPSMPASVPPSIPASMPVSEQKPMSEDSVNNANYQTVYGAAPGAPEDVNLQTRLSNSKEALKLPLGAKPADERLDKFLFGHGYTIAREVQLRQTCSLTGRCCRQKPAFLLERLAKVPLALSIVVPADVTTLKTQFSRLSSHLRFEVRFMEAFVDRSSDSMVIAMPPKKQPVRLCGVSILSSGLLALGLSREAMELVTGGDLLSSLTGEPQHYEDTSNIQAVVPMSDRFSLFNYLPDMSQGTECSAAEGFYSLVANDIHGNPVQFAGMQGRAVLVANELNKHFSGRLVVLAFPCNQFGQQEPGSASEIKAFVKAQGAPIDDSDTGFRLMEKVDVNGPGTHPVYKFLKESSEAADIKWNFGSYFLVSHVGAVTRLAGGKNSPMSFKALAHAHEMGVVHRDLKPENILLRQGDRFPKVADFGLSRSLRNSEMAMTVAGTPTYMAPEIQDPRLPYDFPADIYSLGCILTDLMDKSFCCSWYAKATPGTHEKMRKRWPDGATPPKFSAPLKELQGSMIGQAPGLRPTCYQVCNDLLTLADTQPLPHVLWQEKTKLPKGAPSQKMLGSELAREIAGRGGYAVGCRVRVFVDGGWHPGEVKHISTSMCPGAVQVHFRRGGDAKGEEAILVCPWQFQQLLRPDPGAITKDERMGTLIFPEQAPPPKTSPSKGSRTPASTPARKEAQVDFTCVGLSCCVLQQRKGSDPVVQHDNSILAPDGCDRKAIRILRKRTDVALVNFWYCKKYSCMEGVVAAEVSLAAEIKKSIEEELNALFFKSGLTMPTRNASSILLINQVSGSFPEQQGLQIAQGPRSSWLVCAACAYPLVRVDELIEEKFECRKDVTWVYELDVLELSTWCYSATNAHDHRFDVVRVLPTGLNRSLAVEGKPTAEFSWFPGFAWAMAHCCHCNRHLGWAFYPESPEEHPERSEQTADAVPPSDLAFFGLVLTKMRESHLHDSEVDEIFTRARSTQQSPNRQEVSSMLRSLRQALRQVPADALLFSYFLSQRREDTSSRESMRSTETTLEDRDRRDPEAQPEQADAEV